MLTRDMKHKSLTAACQMVSNLLWWVDVFVNLVPMESVPPQP